MTPEPIDEHLSETKASQLLERASQLDALRHTGAPVSELRAAAIEAGISAQAFDAALEELQARDMARPAGNSLRTWRHPRRWAAVAGMVLLAGVGVVELGRAIAPDAPVTPLTVQSLPLGCLSGADAAEFVRPILSSPQNEVVYREGTRVLTVRGTPEQLKTVRDALALEQRRVQGPNGSCQR